MRILEIVHGFPPAGSGGTEIYAQAHARALARRGHEVTVLTRENDRSRSDYDVRRDCCGELEIISINNTFRSTRSFQESYCNPVIEGIASDVIREARPDVAHVHHLTGLSTSLLSALRASEIPTVMTLHDYWLICHRGQLLDTAYRVCDGPSQGGCESCLGDTGAMPSPAAVARPAMQWLEEALPSAGRVVRQASRWTATQLAGDRRAAARANARAEHMREVCGKVDRLLAPSVYLRDRFVTFGVPASLIAVWPLGVEQARFRATRHEPGERLRIGFLGSLMVSKAPHVVLEAYSRLPSGSATVTLIGSYSPYHGDDSYRSRLRPLMHQPGVRELGAVTHAGIPAVLAALDVLVVPSIWPENSPLVVREAFLSGVPVVASRIGGLPEMVEHDVNGKLFEPGDVAGLHRILQSFVDHPGEIDRLRAGIPSVRTIEDDVEQVERLYGTLRREVR